jgi:group I intron endonuclease
MWYFDSMGCVYCATNIVNGKKYVGLTTTTLKHRMGQHLASSRTGVGLQYFHQAIRKYGESAFLWEVLIDTDSVADLRRHETRFIRDLNTFRPNGYNLTLGGEVSMMTEEIKKKIGDANRGRKPSEYCLQRGRETVRFFSPERRLEISERMKARPKPDDEMRNRIRNKLMGHKHSEETKRRIGQAGKGKNTGSSNHKSRSVVCIETGEIFPTITSAALGRGSLENIHRCVSGRNKTAFGLHWKYADAES